MGRPVNSFFPRRASLVLLAIICSLSFAGPGGGGGPENTLVVVNPTAAGSMKIANLFQKLRGIPEKNMFYLPASNMTWANADSGYGS